MPTELALWQQLALAVLALLSALYVFYFRIWVALATGSDLLFASALCICVLGVAVPSVFERGAHWAVSASPLPDALAEADQRVIDLETMPSRLINRALRKIGFEREAEESLLAAAAATPGPFESRVRPAVEGLVALILRGTSCVGSFFVLLMALALRSSTATARELDELNQRLDRLAARESAA